MNWDKKPTRWAEERSLQRDIRIGNILTVILINLIVVGAVATAILQIIDN